MTDRILTLKQVIDEGIVPLSRSTLYRVVEEEGSPFWKRGGRWLTVESDLYRWVREGEKGAQQPRSRGNPMAKARRGDTDQFLARVEEVKEKLS